MKSLISLLVAVLLAATSLGQNNSCPTTVQYSDNVFISYNPPTNWVNFYRVFESPSTSIDFSFSISVRADLCPTTAIQYSLYVVMGSMCVEVENNTTGFFTGLTPGNTYIIGFIANCTQLGINGVFTAEDITLPIELIYFTGESVNGLINLTWASGSEFNCAGYAIDRSTDASTWINIGYVEGAGNSQQIERYLFTDRSPVKGVSYYRLVQYDLNGDFEVLKIIAIFFNPQSDGNPFRQYNTLGQRVAN
jgi:hypothetical protein